MNEQRLILEIERMKRDIERLKVWERPFGLISWKSHRAGNYKFSAADTWYDMTWDLKITDECNGAISYYDEGGASEDKSIIVIANSTDLFYVGGSLHPLYGGLANATVLLASRILYSTDLGSTWNEARCLQSADMYNKNTNDIGILHYLGSIRADGETWVKLQVRTDNTDVTLTGYGVFDNPVAATIAMHSLGM